MDEKMVLFDNIVREIRNSGTQLWLFGCGDLGQYAQIVFSNLGLDVAGYISNQRTAEEMLFDGKVVKLPKEVIDENSDVYVAICIFTDKTAQAVKDQLWEMGYRKFIEPDIIAEAYLFMNLKPIGFRVDNAGGIRADYFTLDITEICSLNCKYCGAFIPYIRGAHYSLDECVKSVRRMAAIVEQIGCITIQGGEPFLHPQFSEICYNICSIDKVNEIRIATNGTIVPSGEFFSLLQPFKDKILIVVSDYGKLNRQLDALQSACHENNFHIMLNPMERGWQKPMIPEKQNQSEKENRNKYVTCKACQICPMIKRGRLYKCATAAMGEMRGVTPRGEQDSVDFLDDSLSDQELKEKLLEYMTTKKPPLACDYCKAGTSVDIPIAEQLTETGWDFQKFKSIY